MKKVDRREALRLLASAGATAAFACSPSTESQKTEQELATMTTPDPVQAIVPLPKGNAPWPTQEPFLFCVHHNDQYPRGNPQFGPDSPLTGRPLGQDFAGKDGWNMYHGQRVPGFPRHPHRGFETVTVVRTGFVDHTDSLGSIARYGQGDVQWLTAGDGINHAEMFPLLNQDDPNPIDFFQIWLNLPAANKRVPPHFSMLWAPSLPVIHKKDTKGRETSITLIAGGYGDAPPPVPPPHSWASTAGSNVTIWTVRMSQNAHFVIPATPAGVTRALYTVTGDGISIGDHVIPNRSQVLLRSESIVSLQNKDTPSELLLLGATPIGEPIAQHGPFVMNTNAELVQTFKDYQRTELGGWPWPTDDPVHGPNPERFARYSDGKVEKPTG